MLKVVCNCGDCCNPYRSSYHKRPGDFRITDWIKMYSHMVRRAIISLVVLLACRPCASALDASLDISQYAHTVWKIRDGFARGPIYSVAQTPDGYLWLSTDYGLLRFDGVRAVHGNRRQASIFPSAKFGACSQRVMGRSGLARRKGSPVGRTASCYNMRSLARKL